MNKTVKTLLIAALVIGVPIVIFMFYATGVYDKAVDSDQTVKEKIGNVSSAYQRRADLFQNLVKVVKAAAKTEKEILVDVVRSRQGMDVVQQEPAQANPQMQQTLDSLGNVIGALKSEAENLGADANMEKIATHENNFTKFRSGFNIVIERYPELKSIKNFQDLQTDITGTENRINTERNYYNEAVKEHNTLILGFFRQWALKFTGGAEKFKEYKPFEHKAGAEDAPDIDI
jgi:LemA protein